GPGRPPAPRPGQLGRDGPGGLGLTSGWPLGGDPPPPRTAARTAPPTGRRPRPPTGPVRPRGDAPHHRPVRVLQPAHGRHADGSGWTGWTHRPCENGPAGGCPGTRAGSSMLVTSPASARSRAALAPHEARLAGAVLAEAGDADAGVLGLEHLG